MTEPVPRRRRRLRHDPATGQALPVGADAELLDVPDAEPPTAPSPAHIAALTSPVHDPEEDEPAAKPDDREAERGLRGLVGGGSSQVNVAAAMRTRDATRPTDEDMSRAEHELTIIRRGWTPPPAVRP